MLSPSSRRVYVTFPGSGEIQVFPKNETLSFGWEYTNDVWRKKLDTKLWFVNEEPAPKTFDIFASLELEECGCHVLPMRVTLECETGVQSNLFSGLLYFIDGEWYFDFCSTEIKPRVNDPFECLFKYWEQDKNILVGSGSPVTLITDLGDFHEELCFAQYDPADYHDYITAYEDSCLGAFPGGDWAPYIHSVNQIGTAVQVATTWIREEYNFAGPPPGASWTQVGPTLWTRPALLQGPSIFEDPGVYHAQWQLMSGELDNGRLLSEVVVNLFSVCPYPIRSDFFGIDPPGDAPVNSAYTYAQEWFWNAVVFSMSEIVYPDAFENATKVMLNLEDLSRCLRAYIKDAIMFFDETLGCYRIEHDSYNRFTKLINFVTKRPDAIRGYNTYTYEKSRIPQKHIGQWSYQTHDEDWDDASIVYPECNDVGNVSKINIDCFHTDFGSLFGSNITEIDVLKGIMIVAQKDGQVHRAVGDISGVVKANGGLSWANIFRNLWRWRMPFCNGLVNGVDRTFNSLIPKIKGKEFLAEVCCEDILLFNPATDRARTGLGNGELDPGGIEFDLNTGMAAWNLLYAPPLTLLDLSISISVNDDNQCYYTNFIFQTNEGFPNQVNVSWDFGSGAVPSTATGEGPHTVFYTTIGIKTVTVTAEYNGEVVTDTIEVTVTNCPGNLAGTVKWSDNSPIVNANVRLYADTNEDGVADNATVLRNVFCNVSGAFSMATLPPGSYVITLMMTGILSGKTINIAKDDTPDGDLGTDLSTTDNVIPVTITPSKLDLNNNFIVNL